MAVVEEFIRLELTEREAQALAALLRNTSWSEGEGEIFEGMFEALAEVDIRGDEYTSVINDEGELELSLVEEVVQ